MKIINLKDYYTYYTDDMFIEIPDELANVFKDFDKAEAAYERKKYRTKLITLLTVAMELSTTSRLFLSRSMRFTNVS